MERIQQFTQSFGQWHHFAKELQTVGHGISFHEMEQVTLGKQVCPMMIRTYVIRATDATNMVSVNQNGDTTIIENLDIGPSQAQTRIKA